jgi:hypothetical protein
VDEKLLQLKYGVTVGRSLSSIFSNIFMEYFEKLAPDIAQHQPSPWLLKFDDWSGLMAQNDYKIFSATLIV